MNKVAVTDEVRKKIFVFFYKQKHLEKKPNRKLNLLFMFSWNLLIYLLN